MEILLETDSHSYYQLAINPAGALVDLDRGAPKSGWFGWSSQAEVATQIADDHWTVEIRIPVVQDENDPLHQVIGRKPTASLPWHVNVCRQRIRENGSEYSAFSPTGKSAFHEPMKFAHFYAGRSQTFDADPTVTDYLIQSRAADDLLRSRKLKEALAAYVALAGAEGVNDYQASAALEQAVRCARNLHDDALAAELADRIPIAAAAKTARMQNLLAQRRWTELIEQFGAEDLSQWPFWKAGEAYSARGSAYLSTGAGAKAEADLSARLGTDLGRSSPARHSLEPWRQPPAQPARRRRGAGRLSADRRPNAQHRQRQYFRGLQSAAQILSRQNKHDDALAVLHHADFDKLRGYWRRRHVPLPGRRPAIRRPPAAGPRRLPGSS